MLANQLEMALSGTPAQALIHRTVIELCDCIRLGVISSALTATLKAVIWWIP